MAAAFEVYNDRGYGLAERIPRSALRSSWPCAACRSSTGSDRRNVSKSQSFCIG